MENTSEANILQDFETAWRACPAVQQPQYPDPAEVTKATAELKQRPPLVFAGEVNELRELLGKATRGEAFVLTGGDCAETFAESTADHLKLKVQTILQMAVVLAYGAGLPVVKMGRMAGQYAKPRSSNTETRDGVTLEAYRGDAVNGHQFTKESRTPDPHRLVESYQYSAASLNLIRAFTQGGYADMRRVHEWNKGFMTNPAYSRFDALARSIDAAMQFMKATGVPSDALRTVDFYSSHEALLLEYESALTRVDSISGDLYDTSAHFIWIGERTRQTDGAHVEMLSRIHNPIGVKLGPTTTPDEVKTLVERLNPEGVAGRLTLIARMGADNVREVLPSLLRAGKETGVPLVWMCDPMHGNTVKTASGYKTRHFGTILDEVRGFFEVHEGESMIPGGIHMELTGDDVTEVVGGTETVDESALAKRYETLVDPRLNHQQSLELAFLVAEMLAGLRPGLQTADLADFPALGF
ncbi:MAG: 3-deoxy-7-phosphoheptulonate synthase class II [Mobiluncus porci]|uniref:class II 3-deoxy-7-phosphoheptulonate synthase n=1 Tax=Mobiluncus porci TaxID=2652278 RepID=UPI0023F5300B|nr:3-deoxy-7-phosphoheptulonate synthase class II [Mobiluncus porci]MDD7541465.1 3-deoxy-7-phosphoheptulonate synthase class II [Mobiluncus porci]MDY5748450.1 3-deoxy-7-phosphoheptulonate synthase class II [Mobiluncus porci]